MKIKEILIICIIIICCIFSLQAVSAADDANTSHDMVSTSMDVSVYTLPNIEDSLQSGSVNAGTFSDLQNDISGDQSTIKLEKNYTYNSSDNLVNGIVISKSVTIDGEGKVIIDADNQARIFNVVNGATVTLKGITFINGNASNGNGGSICSDGVLNIIDCNFINNTATGHGGALYFDHSTYSTIENCVFTGNVAGLNGGAVDWHAGSTNGKVINSDFKNNTAKRSGGAIHWSGHNGMIKDSNFTNNNATGDVISEIGGIVGGGDGGAVIWVGSNGTVENCIFDANFAQYRGGAIFLHGNSTENCTNTSVSNSKFESNVAGTNGGAIDWNKGAHNGLVENVTFINNTAKRSGGAIYWNGNDGTIRHSNFTGNKALGIANATDAFGNVTYGGDGGAVIWIGSDGEVDNCTFIGNNATKRGGAVYLQRSSEGDCRNTVFINSIFDSNVAGTNGGAIDWNKGAHDGLVENVTFVNNTAKRSGGAIYWNGNYGKIKHSNFTDNKALGINNASDAFGNITYGGDGGAVIWIGSDGEVDNCTFSDNEAAKRGGAVYLQANSDGYCNNTKFINSLFENNVAGTNGGAIDWNKGAHNGIVDNVTFINNTAKRSGGAIFWNGHNGTIQDSRFYDNHALGIANATNVYGEITYGGNGGALMWSGAMGNVIDSNFTNNTAAKHGGAVYLQGSESENSENTRFDHANFINNAAGVDGGAIAFEVGVTEGFIDHSTFINNTATRNGGAINFLAGSSGGHIYNSTFDNNTAKRSGGAFYWEGNNGTVMYCNFTNNRALGVTLQYNMTLTYDNIVVVNNTLPTASDSTMNKLYVLDTSTDKNHINYASYVSEKINGTYTWKQLDEAHFVNDTAPSPTDWGMDQFFGGNGGTILWGGDLGTIDHCIITGSNSARRGGGAYMRGSNNITFSNCEFANDTSGTNGGALDWLAGANYGRVINCTFEDNQAARSAGTIYYDGDYGQFINITIKNSYAHGGDLKTSSDGIVHYAGWDSSHWDTNTTGGDAGAIMITGNHVYIYNATFTNCTAVGRGGAIFLQDNHNVTFDLCTFEDNRALGTANNTYNNPRDTNSRLNSWKTGLGGAVGFDLGASNGTIKNSKFINNTAARDGGAISFAYGSSNATIYNSVFESNTAKRSGGAFAWNGNNGNISYCNFTNNAALGTALDTDHANITSLSQVVNLDMLPVATEETINKIYVLVTLDDDDKPIGYSLYVTVPVGDNGYDWLLHVETNVTDPSPTDWGVDEYFGGDGGSILWGGDNGLIDNCIFIDSNSARRGGGAYMLGSDHVTVSNSYFENCTSGTNGGGLDWLAGANHGKVINSTFNNTRAARSAGAIYYDGDYGQMINVTIINTTAFGGSLDNSSDGKVKYAGWDSSHWDTNTTGGDAGAIMITGDHVYIYNATFTGCTAVGRGGAVFLQDNENATFDLCIFENNRALGIANNTWKNYTQERDDSNPDTQVNYDYTGHGGAIAFDFGANDCLIEDSVFINNYGRRDGGAINFAEGALNNVINSTKFINNSAGDDGGAINWEGDGGAIENITCYNNTGLSQGDSSSRGGTICLTGSDVVITKSNFTVSTILRGNTTSIDKLDGGTIFITGNDVNITDSVFSNSTAIHYGGTIYILGNYTLIANCDFEETNAIHGGTIYVEGDYVTIDGSTFTKSNATDGGAIYIAGDSATVSNSAFSNINATDYGGVLYVLGRDGKLFNSNFTDNFAGKDGGAVYWQGYNGLISGSRFEYNKALGSGDRIHYKEVFNKNTGVTEKRYNITGGDGGAIMLKGSHTIIENSTFYKNTAEYCGGAIYLIGVGSEHCTNITFKDCNFTDNLAKLNGGAVDWASGASNATVTGSSFVNNKAYRSAGAIYVSGDDLDIEDTEFISNEATKQTTYDNRTSAGIFSSEGGNAGAICWMGSYGTIVNGTFIDNTAAVRGGAIQFEGSLNASVKDSRFENNYAGTDGGAIDWYKGASNGLINNTEFINNRANEYGGSIFIEGDDNVVSYSRFEDSFARKEGGSIYVTGDDVNITDSVFKHSRVDSVDGENGGALYIEGDYTSIISSNFTDCTVSTAGSQGGAIYIKGDFTTVEKSNFVSNSAKGNGGTIYVRGNNATISESIFNASTSSSGYGGAMYVQGNGAVISWSNFTSNEAKIAGAMYINGNNATISYSLFKKNSVSNNQAGALFNNGIGSRVLYSNFTDNSAGKRTSRSQEYPGGEGGAIYWKGGSEIDAIEGCIFDNNSAKFGGAIRWVATGSSGIIHDCTFVRNNGEKGGTISWNSNQVGHIDDCRFISNVGSKNGGALYLQNAGNTFFVTNTKFINNTAEYCGADIANNFKYAIIENCSFVNSTAGYGGSIVMKEKDPSYSQIINCNFTNTRSLGIEAAKYDADGDVYANGGGAIYVTYSNIKVINSTFTNCSSNTDGGVFKWFTSTGGGGVLENVTIINAKATGESKTAASTVASGDGGAIYWLANSPTFKNVTIINASAKTNGGGIYLSGSSANLNGVTIENSSAKNGGGIYWANSGGTIKNITLINNSATYGGGFYTELFTGTIVDSNFTLNKADSGSAIYTTQNLKLNDTSILKNRANNASFNATIDFNTMTIEIDFKGWDNYLNGIFVSDITKTIKCDNVTFLNESGVVNTGIRTYRNNSPEPTLESGQNFTVIIGNEWGQQINIGNDIFSTDKNGHISINITDLIPPGTSYNSLFADVYLTNEDYYTYVEKSTRILPGISASTTNATFHLNGTVTVYLSPYIATGNVSVYINDEFKGNITLENGQGTIEVSTLVNGEYLKVGNHTVVLKYHGDGLYRPVETTAILNVTKAESRILFNVTPSFYDFIINVTVEHNDTGIVTDPNDVTGNVTLYVRGQIINVQLVNGTGIGIAYNMPSGPVLIEATYSGDDNYKASSNFTYGNIIERIRTLVEINVTSGDIMVDETVYIEVTVISNETVEGNITIILDNVEYNVTLNNSKAIFNKTGLPAGPKIVTAIFAGNETLAPSSDYDHFNVFKYDAFILIDDKNITHGSEEVIIITVPSDVAQGTVNVTINGTTFKYKHILEIINGTVEIDLSNLNVDVYNITAKFESSKYKFTTNSSIFKVSKLKPPIVINVDNVTYGNDTVIFVEVVGAVGGNVTLKINEDLIVFENRSLVNDTANFTVRLPVGNYVIDVIYSGDESDLANTAKSKFSVLKANPTIDISVYDIRFGEREDMTIGVNAAGNVTIKLDGVVIAENVTLDDNNKTSKRLENLRTGKHTIEVIYGGNDNFNSGIGKAEFNVNSMETKVYAVVNNIFVWDTAHIEVRVLDNKGYLIKGAPGNVTININGVDYTSKIIGGIATFDIGNLSVGHKVLWAFYDGDGDLGQSKATLGFEVKQRTPDVSVTAINVTTMENGKIIVHVPANATGYVIVTGNFTNYQIRVDNFNQGIAEIPLDKLANGTYSVHIKYYGESYDNYTMAENDCIFNVSLANATINIAVEDITYGDKLNITVTVADGATGSITVGINETTNVTLPIVNGKVNWIVEGLGVENYTVWANYSGDTRYNINSTNKTFKVKMVNSVLNILTPVSVDAATNATIIVTVNETATGNITITVNGTKYNATIENGVATFVINKLLGGTYDITAEYIGDGNNTAAATVTAQNALVVTKVVCYQINVSANDTMVGLNTTIVINVPVDAQGNVSVYVDGVEVGNATIDHGVAVLNVTKAYGNHTVNVTFSDGKYDFRYAVTDYWVFKYDSPLVIDVDSILVGDIAYINVTAPSDNVTIEINGKSYNRNRYVNGVAYFNVAGLDYGNKTVVAIYGGSEKYVQNTATKNFTVDKRSSYIKVNVSDIIVREIAVINVTVPNNATGIVIVSINGTHYAVNVSRGIGSVEVKGLGNGTYRINATYAGDNQYFSSENNTQTFDVRKVQSNINLTVSQYGIIANGSDVNITIKAPADATGKVNVTISNGVENKSYIVYLNEGTGNLHLETPEIGIYNVTAKYLGDDKYLGSENKTEFEVYINRKELDVTTEPINVNQDETILVYVTGNHVGKEVEIVVKDSEGNIITMQNISFYSYIPGLNGSSAKLELGNLDAGEYTVDAVYIEVNGTKIIEHKGSGSFKVSELPSHLSIKEIKNITVGENVTIELEFDPDEATGNISVFVNGIEHVINTTNLKLIIPNLGAEEYYVHAFYYGDKNYLESNASAKFKVSKNPVPIEINVTNSKVGEVEQINVTLVKNATGRVLLDIGDNHYYANLTNGSATFNIKKLDAGNYDFTVTYEGDDKYLSNKSDSSFIVSKYQPKFTINGTDIKFGSDELITFETSDNITAPVKVEINGVNHTSFINEGKGNLTVYDLPAGDYNITLYFLGNEKYLNASAKNNFTVNKSSVVISVIPVNITYLDNETVVVYVDAIGNVTLKVDTYENTTELIDGKATFVINGLVPGNYTANATFNGNLNLTSVSAKANFTVFKVDPIISLDVQNITYGDMEHIIVHVNAEGNVTIRVNGTERTIDLKTDDSGYVILRANLNDISSYDGKAHEYIYNLKPGKYPVEVIYNGNECYNTATINGVFYVIKANASIKVDVENIDVGDVAFINVTLPQNATGNVTIEINGKEYKPESFTDGVARFKVVNLTHGNKTVAVKYSGDDNYTANFTTVNFTVSKVTPQITVNATNINVGDKVLIEVTAPIDVTNPVLVDVDGVGYYVNITGGKGKLYVPDLTGGNHNVTARYPGDEKYLEAKDTTNFTASKVPSNVNVSVENITFGENAVVNVETPSDLLGNVTVCVDGKNYTVPVSGGKGTLVVPGLAAGPHTVKVIFDGSDKYEPSDDSVIFNVAKSELTPSDIKVINQGNNSVVVVVPGNATGNVTVKVGDKEFNATVVNGTAVVKLENVTPGEHEIEVIYSGDDNYENATVNSTVVVPKLESSANVTCEVVGDKAIITVDVHDDAKGNVTIEIDGEKYSVPIEGGKATFEVDNLTVGNKTIAVNYPGDDNYMPNHTTASITVSKLPSFVNAKISDIKAGENVTIEVSVPENATGQVLIDIDGVGYYVNVTGGKGVLEIPNILSGSHNVTLTYAGDDKYDKSSSTASFEVSKLPSNINVAVEDISFGEDAVINVETPEDLDGNVTVCVDGKNYTVPVSGGKGTLVVPGLAVGPHDVDVIFGGSDKYEPSSDSTTFDVAKAELNPDDIKVIDQGNGTVVVVVPDNATGNITVKVGNNTYNATIKDGIATITLDNETPGQKEIEIIYSGDDNYDNATTNAVVTIPKAQTPISIDVDDILVGDNAVVKVNLPSDATGSVTIEIDGKSYTAPVKNGVATFEVPDLSCGNKTLVASYSGDAKYPSNYNTDKFSVSKRIATFDVEIDDIDVGENVIVIVTLPNDATGQVLIDIDGVGYYANLTNGVAVASIPRIPSGVYNVNVTYVGDDKYLSNSTKGEFNVTKIKSFVIPSAKDIMVGDDEILTFTLPEDATGILVVDDVRLISIYNGDEYIVYINEGTGELNVSGLPEGRYIVSVRYNGDEKYLPSDNSTSFKVSKRPMDLDVVDYGNRTVVVSVPENATGTVTIVIENQTYVANITDGKAVFYLENATPGVHNITVIYSGDDTYEIASVDSNVKIPKYEPSMSVSSEDIAIGDSETITINLPEDAKGTVTIEIDGKTYSANVIDGKAVFNVPGLTVGNKTLTVKYSGDDKYEPTQTTANFTVSKCEAPIEANSHDIKVGSDETILVYFPKDATGRALLRLGLDEYYADIIDGVAKIRIPNLLSGNYEVEIYYEGDDKYLPNSTIATFTVTKNNEPVIATGDDIKIGGDGTVVVFLPSDATGTVTIVVDGKSYTAEVVNGKAVFSIPGLGVGVHVVDVYYSGDDKYEANHTTTQIIVEDDNPVSPENESGVPEYEETVLSKYPTANPILVLLLMLMAVGSISIRRLKK